ncbi:MAG: DUF3037 domain-containing protein [Candidatus Sulfotelmatobacter sp.]
MQRTLEYFFLQYAPNALREECVNVALIQLDSGATERGICSFRVAKDWVGRVQSIDPDADIEMLAAVWTEFERMLSDPERSRETLRMIEDSFSNLLRASSRRKCDCEVDSSGIDLLASRYL